jgi:pimeloyl-ACP methyl ester carboxylesterase
MWRRAVMACVLVLLFSACSRPIAVTRVGAAAVDRQLTASVLSSDRLSISTRNDLLEHDLLVKFDDEPEVVLAELHRLMRAARGAADDLFALAELSFLHAQKTESAAHYLAAAVYAYAFLFPDGPGSAPSRFDARLRLAGDLYNRALTLALQTEDGSEVVPRGGNFALPFGGLAVEMDPAQLRIGERALYGFAPVAEFEVSGLAMRYRRAGLGVPLAAATLPPDPSSPTHDFVAPSVRISVTLFLRVSEARRSLVEGKPLTATLEAFLTDEFESTEVGSERVPLEAEPTAAIALTVAQFPVIKLEIEHFLTGLGRAHRAPNLVSLVPYRPGLVPVVFVHGTVSSPVRWAEMLNRLEADPAIRRACQFWFFSYHSANPIAYSSLQLRRALTDAVAALDPRGRDPALQRMVLIGHSQGGLLVKMAVVDSGDALWKNVSPRPLDALRLSAETRELLQEGFFVKPLPSVARVVFIATPHRGSFVAGRQLMASLLRRLITLPVQISAAATDLAENRDLLTSTEILIPSAVDNMSPRNPFIRTLQAIAIAPDVRVNSIIAVKGKGPVAEGDDGVVAYSSAHLVGVESEFVVQSGHSTLGNPETIEEVRRILRLHVGAPLGRPPAP